MLADWDGPEAGERPSGYIVIMGETGARGRLNAIDMGIAAQTMQLAASTRGLGCCIFLSFDPRLIREALGIPAELEPLLVMAVGPGKGSAPRGRPESGRLPRTTGGTPEACTTCRSALLRKLLIIRR
ncbi:MAG: nitroreductase family protein [Bilophila sp.]